MSLGSRLFLLAPASAFAVRLSSRNVFRAALRRNYSAERRLRQDWRRGFRRRRTDGAGRRFRFINRNDKIAVRGRVEIDGSVGFGVSVGRRLQDASTAERNVRRRRGKGGER